MRKKLLKILSVLLIFVLLASNVTIISAEEKPENVSPENFLKDLPNIIGEEEALENRYVSRLTEFENDLYSLVFRCEDGTNTIRLFSHPVKYVDGEGKAKDITLDIAENGSDGFITKDNEIKSVFPSRLNDGISILYREVNLKSTPVFEGLANQEENPRAALSDDKRTVTYQLNDKTSLEYSLTYAGYKENIILSEYNGVNKYDFLLETSGAAIISDEEGTVYAADAEGNVLANFGGVMIYSADGKITFGEISCETITENELYRISIDIDEGFLTDPETAYPLKIDPTIEISYSTFGSGAIEDVTLNSNAGSSPNSNSLSVGKRETYGKSRVLMRFNGLNLGLISKSSLINSATVKLYDLNQESASMIVYCRAYTDPNWNLSSITWSGMSESSISSIGTQQTISHSLGLQQTPANWYSFDILEVVKAWKDGTIEMMGGIIFKANPSVETSSTNLSKTFASFNRASYKPSLTVNYSYDPFYSTNSDYLFYCNPDTLYDSFLQHRAGSYGFAMRMTYSGTLDTDYYTHYPIEYTQRPGEFATKPISGYQYTLDYEDLENAFGQYTSSYGLNAGFVYNMASADMQALGYSTELVYPSESEIPNASENSDKRLILLVTSQPTGYEDGKYLSDYHFYMQNSDNTWSHKFNDGIATNNSIEGNEALTNINIFSHKFDGIYDYQYKFFYITKPAVIDFRNGNGHYNACTSTPLDNSGTYADLAASRFFNAKELSNNPWSINGRMDYRGDEDVYRFKFTSSYVMQISVDQMPNWSSPYPSFTVYLYDENGSLIDSFQNSYYNYNFMIVSITANKYYYLKVVETNLTSFNPSMNYQVWFLDD